MQEDRLGALWRGCRAEIAVTIPYLHFARPQSASFDWVRATIGPDNPETFGDTLRFESPP